MSEIALDKSNLSKNTGLTELEFANRIKAAGGQAYVVGGYVRDKLRGAEAKDKDYVVCHITQEAFLDCCPNAKLVGNSFPVYLVKIDGVSCEVAFARVERKNGSGYKGFDVDASKNVSIEEDLYRRDTTMNAMAISLPDGRLLDPYNGQSSIKERKIYVVSHHFLEDPVRALRCARQAAQLSFQVDASVIELMSQCGAELSQEPHERIFNEMKLALGAKRPSIFFRLLREAQLIDTISPELAKLIGKTQPLEFHPEGDAWNHTMNVVDEVSAHTDSLVARFCGLIHDLGKGVTPEDMLPHHYGHEVKGQDVLTEMNRRMTLPKAWLKAGMFVIRSHMRAPRITKPGKIVDLLVSIYSIRSELALKDYKEIIRADHHSLPIYLERAEDAMTAILKVSGNDVPADIRGKKIGDWIRSQQINRYMEWLQRM